MNAVWTNWELWWLYVAALNRAKSLLDKTMEQANRTKVYFEQLVHIHDLILDLKNYTDQSTTHSRDARNMITENRRLLRIVLVCWSSSLSRVAIG